MEKERTQPINKLLRNEKSYVGNLLKKIKDDMRYQIIDKLLRNEKSYVGNLFKKIMDDLINQIIEGNIRDEKGISTIQIRDIQSLELLRNEIKNITNSN